MQIKELRKGNLPKKKGLNTMLEYENVRFVTKDKKDIIYSNESGTHIVKIRNTILSFKEYSDLVAFLKQYTIKKGIILSESMTA